MEWVPLIDKIPPKDKKIMFVSRMYGIFLGRYDGKNFWTANNIKLKDIYQWMEVPNVK